MTFEHVFPASHDESKSTQYDIPTFSFIIVATKIVPHAKPGLVETLEPYVTPGKSTIVLIQNGVGIEDDIQAHWPNNLVLTCVVRMVLIAL